MEQSELMLGDIVEYANEGLACFCKVKGIVNGNILLETIKGKGEYVTTVDNIRSVQLSELFLRTNGFLHGTNPARDHDYFDMVIGPGRRVNVIFRNHELSDIEIYADSRLTSSNIKDIHIFQNALRSCGLFKLADTLHL